MPTTEPHTLTWTNAREVFGDSRSRSLVILNPTDYMLTSSKFGFIHSRYTLRIPLKRSVILLKFRTLTGYFSNLTGSSVTNRWFSLSSDLDPSILKIKANFLH